MIRKIDDWAFDVVFQPFSHWFQRMTGKDNFFLGYCCVVLEGSLKLYGILSADSHNKFIFSLQMGGILLTMLGAVVVRAAEWINGIANNKHNATLNMLRIQPLFVLSRYLSYPPIVFGGILVVVHPSLASVLSTVQSLSVTGVLYFAACSPLPPQKSKIGEWLSSVRNGIRNSSTIPAT